MPTEIAANTTYYVVAISSTKIKLATTQDNAYDGTTMSITAGGSYVMTLNCDLAKLAGNAVTHIGIYRSLNFNGNTSDGFDPETSQGNSKEIAAWVGDIPVGTSTFTDSKPDDEIRFRLNYNTSSLRGRGKVLIPNGAVGHIVGGWVFCAERQGNELSYSSIGEVKEDFGYYDPSIQVKRFDQGIVQLVSSEDSLLVLCSNQTHPVTTTQFRELGPDNRPQLSHFPQPDKTKGVLDHTAIAPMEGGTFVAVTSDQSVRIWDGTRWGDDLSQDSVNEKVKKFVQGTIASYYQGIVRIWYRDDSTETYTNKSLRLGVRKIGGIGWSNRDGSNWIYPPPFGGVHVIQDGNNIQRHIAFDGSSRKVYWIDTFDSYDGSNLQRRDAEKFQLEGAVEASKNYFFDPLDDSSINSAF
ncbi:MAG: hypothetical protein VXB01_06220, partial [Opitutae bacterium]